MTPAADLRAGHVVALPGIRRPQVITECHNVKVWVDDLAQMGCGELVRISSSLATHTMWIEHRDSIRVWPAWRVQLDRALVWLGILTEQDAAGVTFIDATEPVRLVAL